MNLSSYFLNWEAPSQWGLDLFPFFSGVGSLGSLPLHTHFRQAGAGWEEHSSPLEVSLPSMNQTFKKMTKYRKIENPSQ